MKTKSITLLAVASLWVTALSAFGQLPIPTGNAELDFPAGDPDVSIKVDFDGPVPNIVLPATAPPGEVSGWDIKDLRFKFFNLPGGEVALGIGFNAFEILGDADGNGDPSTTDPWLSASGGDDVADLGLSESLVLIIDVDEDGTPDAAIGVKPGESLVIDGIKIEASKPNLQNPPGSFDGPLSDPLPSISNVSPSPSAASPDLVFFIRNFQAIPPSSGVNDDEVFFVMAWMGSQDDAGVGEDFAPFFNGFTSIRGSIGNTLYCDRDGDGFFGAGDDPLAEVVVDLFDGGGNYVGSDTTNEFGFYVFTGLPGDDYTVDLAPENFASGGVMEGFLPSSDQSASPLDGANRALPHVVSLGNGEDYFLADFGFDCEPPEDCEGYTPGFWKQCQHFVYWTNYTTGQSFLDVFGVGFEDSLLEALGAGGGGAIALGRHAVAALLNAAHPDVDYRFSIEEIIAMVQGAYASGEFESVKDQLQEQNECGGDLKSLSRPPCDPNTPKCDPKGDPKGGGKSKRSSGSSKRKTKGDGRNGDSPKNRAPKSDDDDDGGPKPGNTHDCESGKGGDDPKDDDDDGGKDPDPKDDDDDGGKDPDPKDDDDDGGKDPGPKDDNDDGGKDSDPKDEDDDGGKDPGPKDDDDDGGKNTDPKDDDDDGGKKSGWRTDDDDRDSGRRTGRRNGWNFRSHGSKSDRDGHDDDD